MKQIVRLIRPEQWIKNLFVLLPLFFSGNMFRIDMLEVSVVAMVAFCLVASSIYCLNDVADADYDRSHPQKKNRPVASGAVSRGVACAVMATLIAVAVVIELWFGGEYGMRVLGVVGVYFTLNVAYSLGLKCIAIVDVVLVALGFVLRVVAGGLAGDILVSKWIIIMTFLLTLFMALAKRRDDVLIYEQSGVKPRSNIYRYNSQFLNLAITVIASVMLVSYIMYSVSAEAAQRIGSDWLYTTSVFVVVGILRYMQLTIVDGKSGSPTKLMLCDKFLQGCVAGWIVLFAILIYM